MAQVDTAALQRCLLRARSVDRAHCLAAVLAAAGVDAARILDTIVAFESFIFGSAYDVSAPADIFAVPEQSLVDAPSLRQALQQRAPGAGVVNPYADQASELGLGLLVEGTVGHGHSMSL